MKASTIIDKAKSYVGTTEYPPNSNNVIFNTDYYGHEVYGSETYPWCMTFVWDIFRMCGASNLFYGGNKTASCPELMRWAKEKDLFVTGTYKHGDVLIFDWDSIKDGDHTGFCIEDKGDTVVTVEGNTSPADHGSQSNGGGVFIRTRSKADITGAYRPPYEEPKNGWVENKSHRWKYCIDGEPFKGDWLEIDGKWYYFSPNGYMLTDRYIKSADYATNGLMYYLKKNGEWNKRSYKWIRDSIGWQFQGVESGHLVRSKFLNIGISDDKKTYYVNAKGYCVCDKTIKIRGKKYTFNEDGELVK